MTGACFSVEVVVSEYGRALTHGEPVEGSKGCRGGQSSCGPLSFRCNVVDGLRMDAVALKLG